MNKRATKLFLFVWILVILGFLAFGLAWSAAEGSTDRTAYLPLIYNGKAVSPPTVTPTPPPGLWLWLMAATNQGDEFRVYATVPGRDWGLKANKIDKTMYISLVCENPNGCEVEPIPPAFPPECQFPYGPWCEIEKITVEANAQWACGTVYPFNCLEAK